MDKGVSVAELRSDGQVGQGSKFMTVYRGMENDVTLAEFERPKHLVVAANNDRRDIDTTYTFTEANGAPDWWSPRTSGRRASRRSSLPCSG